MAATTQEYRYQENEKVVEEMETVILDRGAANR